MVDHLNNGNPIPAILILGRGESAHMLDPWHALLKEKYGHVEVWAMNERQPYMETMHFEMHWPRHHYGLRSDILLCVHWQAEIDGPNIVHYPRKWVQAKTGIWRCLSSQLSYMLALAASIGPEVVALPGCDLVEEGLHNREHERADAQFWLGVLHGMCRTEFMIHERSRLLPFAEYS